MSEWEALLERNKQEMTHSFDAVRYVRCVQSVLSLLLCCCLFVRCVLMSSVDFA